MQLSYSAGTTFYSDDDHVLTGDVETFFKTGESLRHRKLFGLFSAEIMLFWIENRYCYESKILLLF